MTGKMPFHEPIIRDLKSIGIYLTASPTAQPANNAAGMEIKS